MKRPIFLVVSLGLNLILATAIVWANRHHSPATSSTKPGDASLATVITSNSSAPATEATPIQTNEITAGFHWSEVESTDYRLYLENLRAIGCPEQRIQDVIAADVDALFAARARDYVAPLQGRFWEFAAKPREIEGLMESHEAALSRLEKEREETLHALFNDDNPHRNRRNEQHTAARKTRNDSRLDFLDETKSAAVIAIEEEQNKTQENIRKAELTGPQAETQKQRETLLRDARAATEQRLRELLSPEEYEEYRLRNSSGAQVRYQLARMTLSEAEAHNIAQAVTAKTDAEATLDAKNPASKSSRAQLEQQTQEQIKQFLGEARYAEYQRATDGRYNQTAQIIERLQFPEQTVVAVYQTRLEAEKLAAQFRADRFTPVEERNAALNLIRSEAENSVRQLVGDKAFKEYQNHSGGWLDGLARPVK